MKTVMRNEYMLKMLRLAGMGLLLWIVPSAASFGLYNRSGKLTVSSVLFNAVVTVVFSILASCSLFQYCRLVTKNLLREGSLMGIISFLYSDVLEMF